MEKPGRLLASWPTTALVALIGIASHLMHAAADELLTVSFPALANGKAGQANATAIMSDAETVLVTVVQSGANPTAPSLRQGDRQVPARMVGHDPISRLAFMRGGQLGGRAPFEWLADARDTVGGTLHAAVNGKTIDFQVKGWVNTVGGKVLPLALLKVTFQGGEPIPGSPLADSRKRIAALYFQGDGTGRGGYAIPAEAVHRVRRDIMRSGEPVRGWLGFTLTPESQAARVVRVLTDSPAALAGVMPGDVLLAVDKRPVAHYADVANAFFYLIPGEPARLRLKRGTQTMEITLTPTRPQAE